MVLKKQTTEFTSTAGKSFRTPVETAVEQVSVLPKTPIMELYSAISTVNPNVQKILGNEINRQKPYLILEGQNEVLNSPPDDLKDIYKKVQERDGSRARKDLIGNNIFTQYGVEKQIAINLGNIADAKTQDFFKTKTIPFEQKDGSIINMPLSSFDVNSDEYKSAVSEFTQTQLLDTKGVRPDLLNQYFFPKQSAALTKAYSDQVSNKADSTLNLLSSSFNDSVLGTYFSIDDYDKNIELNIIDNDGFIDGNKYALDELQSNIRDLEKRGLQEAVSPANMLKMIESSGYKIIEAYLEEGLTMAEALERFDDFTEFVGDLKVGPRTITKNKDVIQSDLSSFYKDGKLLEIRKNILKKINDVNKEETDALENQDKKEIMQTIEGLDMQSSDVDVIKSNYETLRNLKIKFGDRIDFIDQQFSLINFNVDAWFDNFELDWLKGEYTGRKEEAITELANFYKNLGSARTTEDGERFTNLQKLIKGTTGTSYMESYPQIQESLNFANDYLKEESSSGAYVIPPNNVDKLYQLEKVLAKDIRNIMRNKDLDSIGKEEAIDARLLIFENDVKKINQGFNFFGNNNNNNNNKQENDTDKQLNQMNLNNKVKKVSSNFDPFANEIKPALGITDGSMIAYNFPTNNQSPEVEPSIINNVVELAKDFSANTKEFTFDTVAKIGKVESSKNFVDFFLDNYIANNAEQNQDLTNLLTEDDQKFLKQETNGILNTNIAKTLLGAKDYQGVQDYVRQQLMMGFGYNNRLGLQNSIGHGNYLDVEHYVKTGEMKFNNTYLFETEDSQTGGSDLLIRMPYSMYSTIMGLPLPNPIKNRFLELVNNAPRRYVVDKIGEDKLKNILDNPYRYTINLGKV